MEEEEVRRMRRSENGRPSISMTGFESVPIGLDSPLERLGLPVREFTVSLGDWSCEECERRVDGG